MATALATWTVDSVHSSVEFSLDYMGFSTYRTRFRALEGSLQFDAAQPGASSVTASIPVASVDVTNDRLMSRLLDLDLLGGRDHPTITFKSTMQTELAHVETELRNIEDAIVHGVVGKTTAALLQDREARRDTLQARLRALADPASVGPLRVGPVEIRAGLEQLDDLLKQDSGRANSVFRQILEPITMTPVEEEGRRFYRATGAAKGPEMLDRLGLAQAVDFGGCGGWICRMLHGRRDPLDKPSLIGVEPVS